MIMTPSPMSKTTLAVCESTKTVFYWNPEDGGRIHHIWFNGERYRELEMCYELLDDDEECVGQTLKGGQHLATVLDENKLTRLYYVDDQGHVQELRQEMEDGLWHHTDITVTADCKVTVCLNGSGRMAASGGEEADLQIIFRDQEHGHINRLFYSRIEKRWKHEDLTTEATDAPNAHEDTYFAILNLNGKQRVFYVDEDNILNELRSDGWCWYNSQIEGGVHKLKVNPTQLSAVLGSNGQMLIYVGAEDSHIYEVCGQREIGLGGNAVTPMGLGPSRNDYIWTFRDLVELTFSHQIAQISTQSLLCVSQSNKKEPSVFFFSQRGHLMEITARNAKWTVRDVSMATNPTIDESRELDPGTSLVLSTVCKFMLKVPHMFYQYTWEDPCTGKSKARLVEVTIDDDKWRPFILFEHIICDQIKELENTPVDQRPLFPRAIFRPMIHQVHSRKIKELNIPPICVKDIPHEDFIILMSEH